MLGKYQRALLIGALLPVTVIAVGTGKMIQGSKLERMNGGCYEGNLPGYGLVQLDLFLDKSNSDASFFEEDAAESDWIDLTTLPPGSFHGDIIGRHRLSKDGFTTNAFVDFRIDDSGRNVTGSITFSGREPSKQFSLHRIFEHGAIRQSSGLFLGRFGADLDFVGQIPLVPEKSAFGKRLSLEIRGQLVATGGQFIHDIRRREDNLRYGNWHTAEVRAEWQPRMVSGSVASFAVWVYPEYGGCGDPQYWLCENYFWSNGCFHEFNLPDLFRKNSGWEAEIRKLCADEFNNNNLDIPAQGVLDAGVKMENFTVSRTGLQIYFNPYEIDGGAAGDYVVNIPYAKIQGLLDEKAPLVVCLASGWP